MVQLKNLDLNFYVMLEFYDYEFPASKKRHNFVKLVITSCKLRNGGGLNR